MSVTRLLLLVGLSVLFVGCSTGRYGNLQSTGNSTGDLGVQHLLGRGVPRDDAKAFYYFKEAAREEDAFAQNEVAYMYAAGKGTPRDYGKAFYYYQKAAHKGLASAQYSLGLMYAHGLGTERNRPLAIRWFQKSASLGFEPARVALERYQ